MAAYNQAPITKAEIYSRPKQSGIDLVGHWGVVVHVTGHGKYLIHNVPGSGTVATAASNMDSKTWTKEKDVSVKSVKTIRGCMSASGGASTNYVANDVARYVMGGTCIGTKNKIVEYLEN
eukprot:TRINITY_DN26161_c0_g1_i1.p1 TRINITY_DN26161_c0_g1~~TRINITY_DN26161_c0_g1_i1.p1  ORF type:complete len:129 (+),score=21.26 TRINITY_DN26161_c0_g1_i1:30-389(+)